MTPQQNESAVPTKETTKKVFDLALFDNVSLVKQYPVPQQPASLEEALGAVGNDQTKLLEVIHKGLMAVAGEYAYKDNNGWGIEAEDGTVQPYSGNYADESKTKLINGAVLNLAKLQAGGSWDTLPKEKKAAFKDSAIGMLRANPDMLKSIAG